MSDRDFQTVCKVTDLAVGRCRAFDVDGGRVVIYHIDDGFYATDSQCPHRGGPLAEGDILGQEIVCPWHLWSFDVTTGINPGSPAGSEIRVRTHEVRVDVESVQVRLSDGEPESA